MQVAGVNALKTSLTGQISAAESKAAGAVSQGNLANAVIEGEVSNVKKLSTMVKNNDQNVVVAISKTLSSSKKTVDRSKVGACHCVHACLHAAVFACHQPGSQPLDVSAGAVGRAGQR
jgi:hypothetical protein